MKQTKVKIRQKQANQFLENSKILNGKEKRNLSPASTTAQ
jgi:hypothetical protein